VVVNRKWLVALAAFVVTGGLTIYGLRAIDHGAAVVTAADDLPRANGASPRGVERQPATLAPPAPPAAAEEEHPTIARERARVEAEAREKILNSQEWREVERAWQQWLSVQEIYDKDDVARLKREFHNRIAQMDSRQLADFLEDMREKIQVLLSPEAQKARVWLGQYLAVHAVIPKDQFKKMVPDVAHMTSEQITESLQAWESRRASVRQTQAAFDEGRKQQVANIQAAEQRNAEAQERALDRAVQSTNNPYPVPTGAGSPYSPPSAPQMNYSFILW
jgi:hypothetical protein